MGYNEHPSTAENENEDSPLCFVRQSRAAARFSVRSLPNRKGKRWRVSRWLFFPSPSPLLALIFPRSLLSLLTLIHATSAGFALGIGAPFCILVASGSVRLFPSTPLVLAYVIFSVACARLKSCFLETPVFSPIRACAEPNLCFDSLSLCVCFRVQ